MSRSSLVGSALAVTLAAVVGCDKGATVPPAENVGGRYVVTKETPFYDSGCQQSRPNDGKLKKNTRFTLVASSGGCWTVKLDDEDETYIQPLHVRAE